MKKPVINKSTSILSIYFVLQLVFIFFFAAGPYVDEGIYLEGGIRIINGEEARLWGNWHNGSPYLWSILAAFIYDFYGLIGVRVFVLVISVCILIVALKISNHYPWSPDKKWILISILLFGPFLWLSHLGIYDMYALLFFILAEYFCLKFSKSKKVTYILFAGLLISLSILSKYAFAIFTPIIFLNLFLRERSFKLIFALTIFAVLPILFHNLFLFESIFPPSYWSFEVLGQNRTWVTSFFLCFFYFFPILFAILSTVSSELMWKEKVFWLVVVLIFPLFHIMTGNPTSQAKHFIYATVYASPFIAISVQKMAQKYKFAVVLLAVFCALQFLIHEYNNVNVKPALTFFEENVDRKTTIASNVGAYVLMFELIDDLDNAENQILRWNPDVSEEVLAKSDYVLWAKFPSDEMALIKLQNEFHIVNSYSSTFVRERTSKGLDFGIHTLDVLILKREKTTAEP
jgi:hypothetical protein